MVNLVEVSAHAGVSGNRNSRNSLRREARASTTMRTYDDAVVAVVSATGLVVSPDVPGMPAAIAAESAAGGEGPPNRYIVGLLPRSILRPANGRTHFGKGCANWAMWRARTSPS